MRLATLLLTKLSLTTPLLCISFLAALQQLFGIFAIDFRWALMLAPFEWAQVLGLQVVMKGGDRRGFERAS